MLQPENLLLALAIMAGAYVWYCARFRTPRFLHLPRRAGRLAVVASGWILIVGIALRLAGAVLGDARIQVTQSGQYVYRSREPARFWRQVAGELLLVGGTGAYLVFVGRKALPAVRQA